MRLDGSVCLQDGSKLRLNELDGKRGNRGGLGGGVGVPKPLRVLTSWNALVSSQRVHASGRLSNVFSASDFISESSSGRL